MAIKRAGIEKINVYAGRCFVDVKAIAIAKGFYGKRFDNLLMRKKSVHFPWEDVVSCAANAAKPILETLTEQEKNKIDLLITATESGVDLGKSASPYIHKLLGLKNECRLFEVKQACYGGTAALQMAVNYILSEVNPGAKALVICSDVAQRSPVHSAEGEISQGAGAVAMLVSESADVLEIEPGAYGLFGREIQDACRPQPGLENADPELSLISFLESAEQAFLNYQSKIKDADILNYFNFLAMHTPFGGMVKGTHRSLLRKFKNLSLAEIESDFEKRLLPSLTYNQEVGNLYSGALYLALCGLIDSVKIDSGEYRVGLFSYGSGSSAEFYSGKISKKSKDSVASMRIDAHLQSRFEIETSIFDRVLEEDFKTRLGAENYKIEDDELAKQYLSQFDGKGIAVLTAIKNYHRIYAWV